MSVDSVYQRIPYQRSEIEHHYGPGVHVLADPYLLSHLAYLCSETTKQPAINHIVRDLYRHLIQTVLNGEFPRELAQVKTRMIEHSPLGIWSGEVLQRHVNTVTVNIARAGTLPSQVCFDFLNKTLEPAGVRQDHVIMARITDKDGHVTGSHFGESKIGGSVEDAIVIFPDPMGATGSSLSEAISHYKTSVPGKAQKYITINLIITPEYIRKMQSMHPDVVIYALRLDRGASSERVLASTPGEYPAEESGLSDKQYILPGGGGFGEIMNNAYC